MNQRNFYYNKNTRPFEQSNQNNIQNYQNRQNSQYSNDYQNSYRIPSSYSASSSRFQHVLTPTDGGFPEKSHKSADLSFNLSEIRLDDVRTPTPVQHSNQHRFSLLPAAALDENGDIRSDWTIQTVVDEGLLMVFAMDKAGCHFLQNHFYGPDSPTQIDEYLRTRVYEDVLLTSDRFYVLATNIFGNFFLQRVIEHARSQEQDVIRRYFSADITAYCLDKSGCRVIQTALEKMRPKIVDQLVDSLPRDEPLMSICTDQNANHVVQKVIKKMPLEKWEFVVSFLCSPKPDNLVAVCQDKYGCRVVQTIIEVLTNSNTADVDKIQVLGKIMGRILSECKRLTSNEFANYVIQHIIETPGMLAEYRDAIIEKCLLRSLLSMSQEKYASHVVERAFTFAPLPILTEMMDEIFDGYLPHPETGKDALDILIFHQFGNYVVQRMLQICCASVLGRRCTIIDGVDCRYKFEGWLNKLSQRAKKDKSRLTRFSSGKKILDVLEKIKNPYDLERRHRLFQQPSDVFFSHYSQIPNSSASVFFSPSNSNSVSSCDHQQTDFDYFPKF